MEGLSPVAQMSFMQILTTRIYLGRGDMDLYSGAVLQFQK